MAQIEKVLVTGGAGFIGSSFVRQLLKNGMPVIVLDALTYSGRRDNLPNDGRLEFVSGDIRDRSLVSDIFSRGGIRSVVNFAAESHVDRSIESPAIFVDSNIVGVGNLLTHALAYFQGLRTDAKESFRFVQISTDEVFGSLGKTGHFTENSPYDPRSPYSASKAGADHLVMAWHHTYGLPTVITHCSNNYGPRQFPEKLIPFMITAALAGKPLGVYGDGSNVRDWIHVEDHCRGIELAMLRAKPGARICFGGRSERSNLEVVGMLCKFLDEMRPRKDGKSYSEQITFVKDRLGHDWRYAIDGSFAAKEIGFEPKFQFEAGLRDTVSWYLGEIK